MFPDPEPYFTFWGDDEPDPDDPEPEPEADDYEPPTCEKCGAVHDDWDNWCEECGAPVGEYARLKEAGMLRAYLDSRTPDPENAPF